MRRLVLFLLFAVVAVAAINLLTTHSRIRINADVWRSADGGVRTKLTLPLKSPIVLNAADGDSVHLSLAGAGADYATRLSVDAIGGIGIAATDGGNNRSRQCNSAKPPGKIVCRLSVRLTDGKAATAIIYATTPDATITNITLKVASAKERAAATEAQLFYGFGALLMLGPLLVWLRRWRDMDRNALIAIGLTWIAVTSWSGLLIDLAFVFCGYWLIRWVAARRKKKSSILAAGVAAVTALLVFIKFVAPSVASSFANPGGFWLALPLGVSYFAIRIIDLIFTAHSGLLKSLNARDYLAFLFMPHTLPAGPILTYQEFLNCRLPTYDLVDFVAGAARMGVGVTKKIAADAFILPAVISLMNSFLDGGRASTPFYVAAMLFLNTVFIYLDFSAYCDLAIGAGRAAGYRIPENFNWPLLQSSVRRFWQAWHMTLTHWVMRRAYFPIFLSSRSVTLSMFASMVIIGLWHALSLSWVMWALHHTAAMATEAKFFPSNGQSQAGSPVRSAWGRFRQRVCYIGGVIFVWSWVSLGHSFTLFSAPDIALQCYRTAAALPLELVRWL
jgi:alginate O-acetyltransferase complex protein AlgI